MALNLVSNSSRNFENARYTFMKPLSISSGDWLFIGAAFSSSSDELPSSSSSSSSSPSSSSSSHDATTFFLRGLGSEDDVEGGARPPRPELGLVALLSPFSLDISAANLSSSRLSSSSPPPMMSSMLGSELGSLRKLARLAQIVARMVEKSSWEKCFKCQCEGSIGKVR